MRGTGDWGPSNRAGHRALRVIGPNSALVMYVVVTVVTSSTGKQSQRVRKQSAGFGEASRPYLVKHVEVPLR